MFHRCNLKLHSLNSINNGNDLEVVAIYEKPDISPLSNVPIDLLISQINSITEDSFNTNQIVAFWGAGHRSLTLISQLSFSKISFIVDSASFKQGTYCPDTGIPIFSPSVLNDNQVDVLFLSLPGSYASGHILLRISCLPSQIYLVGVIFFPIISLTCLSGYCFLFVLASFLYFPFIYFLFFY